MKLSQLRKCDNCRGVLAPQGLFYVLRLSMALVSPQAFDQTVGLMQIFGDQSNRGLWGLSVAEAMSPNSEVVKVAGDEEPLLMTELLICQTCYLENPIDLAMLQEQRNSERKKKAKPQ